MYLSHSPHVHRHVVAEGDAAAAGHGVARTARRSLPCPDNFAHFDAYFCRASKSHATDYQGYQYKQTLCEMAGACKNILATQRKIKRFFRLHVVKENNKAVFYMNLVNFLLVLNSSSILI